MSNENKRYRDVTEADIGKLVVVRDDECEQWRQNKLTAIDHGNAFPYECFVFSWQFARIEVEEALKASRRDPGEGWKIISHSEAFGDHLAERWSVGMSKWVAIDHPHNYSDLHTYRARIEAPKPEPWAPKVGDWVKITKPLETLEHSIVWMQGMDKYNGAVVQVSQVLDCKSIAVDNWSFLFAWLTPCEAPKVQFNASPNDDSFPYIEIDIEFPFCSEREPKTSFTTTFSTISTGKQSHLDADFTLLPPTATRLVAECLAYGERKYGEGNYKRISIKDHLNHAVAHVFEHLSSDNTEDHLIHAATRLLLALEVCSDKDRKYQEPKEVQGE
jgi:hypothetical protein